MDCATLFENRNIRVLDLGCGKNKIKVDNAEVIGFDKNPDLIGVDVVGDAKDGLPFDKNEFDVVYCSHFLEHFNGEELIALMKEIYYILKPGGELVIKVPYWTSVNSVCDVTHKIFFSYRSFEFLNKADFWHYYIPDVDFKTVHRELVFSTDRLKFLNWIINPFINKFHGFYEKFLCHVLPASELRITLKKAI